MTSEILLHHKNCNSENSKISINQNFLQFHQHNDNFSKLVLMFEYDIDNALNTIREKNKTLMTAYVQSKNVTEEIDRNNNSKIKQINKDDSTESSQTSSTHASTITSSSASSLDSQQQPTNARKRWKILAKVLRKDSSEDLQQQQDDQQSQRKSQSLSFEEDEMESTASVRRFKTFDLLQQNNFEDSVKLNLLGKRENWYTYKIKLNQNEYSVNIHHIDRHLTASDLIGFNNTGNICVWPSEEALTVYALSDLNFYNNKWILELGGGMTCLTGLMLAKYAKPFICNLTDGNVVSINNVRKTICLNELSCYTKCSILKWENLSHRTADEFEKFDVILSADCLFFDDVRQALVDTIWYFLNPDGIAIIMAPKRGKTMMRFIDNCQKKGFQYQISYCYNEIIWQRHLELKKSKLYDEDIHYPILLKLFKKIK